MRALAALALAAALVPAGSSAANVTPGQANALGHQAYLYGFPLLEFLRVRATNTSVRCPDRAGNAPINAFSNAAGFARPQDRTVVAPNVDTLYSIAQLDLGRGRVVLSHPAMGHRYFVFELVDPYTNVLGYIGTRTTGSRAGRFAITWSKHPGPRAGGAKVLRVSSRRVWVIGRTLASGPADQRRAQKLMRRYTLSPAGGPRRFAANCRPGAPHKAATPSGLAFLDALAGALRHNPPPARDQPLLEQLKAAGVGPGLRPQDAGLSAAALQALADGVDQAAAALPGLTKASILARAKAGGGWATPPANIGDYGTDYTTRAAIALAGLGANTPIEAVYPTAYVDDSGQTLDGAQRYRLTFGPGRLPPARAFWSLTMYDADGYLVSNAANRYAIGSSHPPLKRRADGSVVVAIQSTPPAEADVNWLPSPAAGAFRLNLRLYWATKAVLDGTWHPPSVVRVQSTR
jgi:hypothetical protein